MRVDIDSHSGFCGGVIRAIGRAEETLDRGLSLYSLGAIVHNEEELARLESRGLRTIGKEDLPTVVSSDRILIRAHGEPPEVYDTLSAVGCEVIDCTCPVVLRLQKSIKEAYERMRSLPEPGQVVIFGKVGHPEVLGLVGQTGGAAIVVENMDQLRAALADGSIRTDRPTAVFSQTTKSPDGYAGICEELHSRMSVEPEIYNTICAQVASRHKELTEFATSHDVVVFVAGSSSSNGRVLSNLCRSVNPRTYDIGSASELRAEWFEGVGSVGISGATSTPKWLLEKVAESILDLH